MSKTSDLTVQNGLAETKGTHEFVGEGGDDFVLDLLRTKGSLSVLTLAAAMQVTPTAVRQRLSRLMAKGFVERVVFRGARGRPGHRYSITKMGLREFGDNFADLAQILWEEVRSIANEEVRRGLLQRLATRMASRYGEKVGGLSYQERIEWLARALNERRVSCEVVRNALPVADGSGVTNELAATHEGAANYESSAEAGLPAPNADLSKMAPSLPVLRLYACPYPELAERDRSVCAMEKMMVSQVVGQTVRLSECRLDGATCCTFEAS